jgi:hypothetical protein
MSNIGRVNVYTCEKCGHVYLLATAVERREKAAQPTLDAMARVVREARTAEERWHHLARLEGDSSFPLREALDALDAIVIPAAIAAKLEALASAGGKL